MIQAAIGAVILLGIYKFMNSKSEYEVSGMMAFVFILGPGFLMFLLSIALNYLELSPSLALLGYALYFILPFCVLKFGLDFQNGPATKFSLVVPAVAVLTEIPFYLLLGSQVA